MAISAAGNVAIAENLGMLWYTACEITAFALLFRAAFG